MNKRPNGMDYETFREERRISNKLTKEYLRGQKDPKQGRHSTRYNLLKQAERSLNKGWSELAPNREKLLGLLEQIKENERRRDTPGDDMVLHMSNKNIMKWKYIFADDNLFHFYHLQIYISIS